MKQKEKIIIGIDEAGRGPLAGPVYAGAVLLPKNHKQLFKKTNAPKKLADSKKLTPAQREEWFAWIKKNVSYAYASVSAKRIDAINIARASNEAAQKSYEKLTLIDKFKGVEHPYKQLDVSIEIIADGGLRIKVNEKFTSTKNKKIAKISFKNFPKADELVPAVSLASIVAKVMRDRYMQKLHKKYPYYAFATHKGYGTKKHYTALKKHGPSPTHRLTFLTSLYTMTRNKGK